MVYALLNLYLAVVVLVFRPPFGLEGSSWRFVLYNLLSAGPTLLVLVPLVIRRLHDRGRSAWWAVRLCGLPYVVFLTVWMLLAFQALEAPALFVVFFLTAAYVSVPFGWFVIEVMFLRGERGANAYGPDPLA